MDSQQMFKAFLRRLGILGRAKTVRRYLTRLRSISLVLDDRPRPTLITRTTAILHPRFPVVDAHNHLSAAFGGGWDRRPACELLDVLDAGGIRVYVDLDGGWGEELLHQHLNQFKDAAPDRFRVFGGVDWKQWLEQGDRFGEWAAARLREQAQRGAEGLKIWKPFGLHVRDQHGVRVAVDDRRLDPLWITAGELRLPVVIHVADPPAFFDPLDRHNERRHELLEHPDWHFPSPPYPSFRTLMTQFASLVERHSSTTFIGAHVGGYPENLGWVGQLLDRCPNFYVDISARINELGRQPYSARRFFCRYADRILFGLDAGPRLDYYRLYYRFLETDDEYFYYRPDTPPSHNDWCIYGLHLPDEVLEKVYYRNAERIMLNGH